MQYMKTLSNSRDKNELLVRFANVRPDSQPRWGAMSAHQMICHLSDSFRGSLGEKYVSPATSLFKRTLLKWVTLWVPLRWPHGIKTLPEMVTSNVVVHRPRSLRPTQRSSVSYSSASVVRRTSSLFTGCLGKCRGPSACGTPIST